MAVMYSVHHPLFRLYWRSSPGSVRGNAQSASTWCITPNSDVRSLASSRRSSWSFTVKPRRSG